MGLPDTPPRTAVVMIVEDEGMVRIVTEQFVTDMGFSVITAPSSEEALALIEAGTEIDLLMTDIRMPGMDGFTLAERVLALRPGIKVVYTTGYADIPARKSGCLLRKPYRPDDLEAELRRALAG